MHINVGLTLVAEEYFPFGLSVMKVIVNALTQKHFHGVGNTYLQNARDRITKHEQELCANFLACGKDMHTDVSEKAKIQIMNKLIAKASNARFEAEVTRYKEEKSS